MSGPASASASVESAEPPSKMSSSSSSSSPLPSAPTSSQGGFESPSKWSPRAGDPPTPSSSTLEEGPSEALGSSSSSSPSSSPSADTPAGKAAQQVWNLIDVPLLKCGSSSQVTTITLPGVNSSSEGAKEPHVLTIYRTSRRALNITFNLTSSNGSTVLPNTTITLMDEGELKGSDDDDRRRLDNLEASSADGGLVDSIKNYVQQLPWASSPLSLLEKEEFKFTQKEFPSQSSEMGEGKPEVDTSHAYLDGAASRCEDFFLLDGRSPVYLPETWSEARLAFRDICHSEAFPVARCGDVEEDIFEDLPRGEEPFEAQFAPELCDRMSALAGLSGSAKPRRMKGGIGAGHASMGGSSYHSAGGVHSWRQSMYSTSTTRTGGEAMRPFSNPGSRYAGNYGYSYCEFRAAYVGPFQPTAYGYSGLLYEPMLPTSYLPVAVMLSMESHMAMANAMHYSRGRTFCRYGNCSSSSEGHASPSECNAAEGKGKNSCLKVALTEPVLRDDLMMTGFVPKDYPGPLTLTITAVEGADFQPDRICPPTDWASGGNSTWKPAPSQDLFVTMTQMEPLIIVEDASGIIMLVVLGFVVLVFLICGFINSQEECLEDMFEDSPVTHCLKCCRRCCCCCCNRRSKPRSPRVLQGIPVPAGKLPTKVPGLAAGSGLGGGGFGAKKACKLCGAEVDKYRFGGMICHDCAAVDKKAQETVHNSDSEDSEFSFPVSKRKHGRYLPVARNSPVPSPIGQSALRPQE